LTSQTGQTQGLKARVFASSEGKSAQAFTFFDEEDSFFRLIRFLKTQNVLVHGTVEQEKKKG
jgi:hypothetical protein